MIILFANVVNKVLQNVCLFVCKKAHLYVRAIVPLIINDSRH
jgi:hypothetical protein